MPRPHSLPAMSSMTYDPYSYYPSHLPHPDHASQSLTVAAKFALEHFVQNIKSCPTSLYGTPASRPRSLSVCSTDSVCSDDSDEEELVEDGGYGEEEALHSPISPAETISTCGTFSSCSSSQSRFSTFFSEPNSPQSASSSSSPAHLTRVQRPRGPRPLPALPTKTAYAPAPREKTTRRTPADIPRIQVTVPSTPPLAWRVKPSPTPPPSYAEATQAALSPIHPWDGARACPAPEPAALPTTEAKDDVIDWDCIEAYMMTCWDG